MSKADAESHYFLQESPFSPICTFLFLYLAECFSTELKLRDERIG